MPHSPTHNFLGFEFIGYGVEREHLRVDAANGEELDNSIAELKLAEPLLSLGEIARRLDTNKMRVKRVLERKDIPQ